MKLPPRVIEHLLKYIDVGCELELVTEEFNGELIDRWIANGNRVLWSAPSEKASGIDNE